MPISREHGVIFIHIPKNAGSSIEEALAIKPSEANLLSTRYSPKYVYAMQHLPYSEVKRAARDCWDSFVKVAVVRNPWDRLVSDWSWRRRGGLAFGDLDFKSFARKACELVMGDTGPSFFKPASAGGGRGGSRGVSTKDFQEGYMGHFTPQVYGVLACLSETSCASYMIAKARKSSPSFDLGSIFHTHAHAHKKMFYLSDSVACSSSSGSISEAGSLTSEVAVLRFESLSKDWARFCRDELGGKDLPLPYSNDSARGSRHYSEEYKGDQQLIDLVGEAYGADASRFGYAFEEARARGPKGGKGFKSLLGGFLGKAKDKQAKDKQAKPGQAAATGAEAGAEAGAARCLTTEAPATAAAAAAAETSVAAAAQGGGAGAEGASRSRGAGDPDSSSPPQAKRARPD